MTNNQIKYWENVERQRSNRANEAETNRHNLAMEGLQYYANQETIRSNKAKEQETTRSNKAREVETNRANVAGELIRTTSNTISANVQRETARHNRSMEVRDLMQLANTRRELTANYQLTSKSQELQQQKINQDEARIDIAAAQLAEDVRHNLATEANTRASTWSNLIGSVASTVGRVVGPLSLKSTPKKIKLR